MKEVIWNPKYNISKLKSNNYYLKVALNITGQQTKDTRNKNRIKLKIPK